MQHELPRPPQVQGGGVTMPDALLAGGLHIDRLKGQGDLDQLFPVGGQRFLPLWRRPALGTRARGTSSGLLPRTYYFTVFSKGGGNGLSPPTTVAYRVVLS